MTGAFKIFELVYGIHRPLPATGQNPTLEPPDIAAVNTCEHPTLCARIRARPVLHPRRAIDVVSSYQDICLAC